MGRSLHIACGRFALVDAAALLQVLAASIGMAKLIVHVVGVLNPLLVSAQGHKRFPFAGPSGGPRDPLWRQSVRDKPENSHVRVVTDPNNEPVRVVDQVSVHPSTGLDVNLTLCTFLDVPFGQGGFDTAAVITARLRMKIGVARALAEALAAQIALTEAADRTAI